MTKTPHQLDIRCWCLPHVHWTKLGDRDAGMVGLHNRNPRDTTKATVRRGHGHP